MQSIGTWWLWASFFIFVTVLLSIDLFLLGGRKAHHVSVRESLAWVLAWAMSAVIFAIGLWWYLHGTQGPEIAQQKALEFFTGYLIEESLSLDNMFVILMIFNFFAIPAIYQRRVLLYGVLGAIIMRFCVILFGILLVNLVHWILYVFGVFLVITGVKMLLLGEAKKDLAENPLVLWLQRHLRLTKELHEEKFFIRQKALWYATPLFLVLVLVEASDLVFAFDSIPAIFAVTRDPFIVFTSNIFAVLGLRALYFLLAGLSTQFHMLKHGIALVLMVVGGKMLIEPWFEMSVLMTLGIVASILVTSVVLSLLIRPQHAR